MARCLTCGVALTEAWLDVYCQPCLDVEHEILAAHLVVNWMPAEAHGYWWQVTVAILKRLEGASGPEAA